MATKAKTTTMKNLPLAFRLLGLLLSSPARLEERTAP